MQIDDTQDVHLNWLCSNSKPYLDLGIAIKRLQQYIQQLFTNGYTNRTRNSFFTKYEELVTLLLHAKSSFPNDCWQTQVLVNDNSVMLSLLMEMTSFKKFDVRHMNLLNLLQLILQCLHSKNPEVNCCALAVVGVVTKLKRTAGGIELMIVENLLRQCCELVVQVTANFVVQYLPREFIEPLFKTFNTCIQQIASSRCRNLMVQYIDNYCRCGVQSSHMNVIVLRVLIVFSNITESTILDWLYKQVLENKHMEAYCALRVHRVAFYSDYRDNRNEDAKKIIEQLDMKIINTRTMMRQSVLICISCILKLYSVPKNIIKFTDQFVSNVHWAILRETDAESLRYLLIITPYIYQSDKSKFKDALTTRIEDAFTDLENIRSDCALIHCISKLLALNHSEFKEHLMKILEVTMRCLLLINNENVKLHLRSVEEISAFVSSIIKNNEYKVIAIQYFSENNRWRELRELVHLCIKLGNESDITVQFVAKVLSCGLLINILEDNQSITEFMRYILCSIDSSMDRLSIILIIFRHYGIQLQRLESKEIEDFVQSTIWNVFYSTFNISNKLLLLSELYFAGYCNSLALFINLLHAMFENIDETQTLMGELSEDIEDTYRVVHALLQMIIAIRRSMLYSRYHKSVLLGVIEQGIFYLEESQQDVQVLLHLMYRAESEMNQI
jgi:hypothetical protein